MSLLQRSKQNGSTATFLIVAIILTLGLISAVYVLRERGNQTRKEQAIATYDKQQNTNKAAESSHKPVDANVGDIEKTSTTVASTQELPTTGTTGSFVELLEVGLLSMLTISYILSRRDLARYL